MPIVTTAHRAFSPTRIPRDVMRRIIDASTKSSAMSEKATNSSIPVYDVPARKIEVIPHGIP